MDSANFIEDLVHWARSHPAQSIDIQSSEQLTDVWDQVFHPRNINTLTMSDELGNKTAYAFVCPCENLNTEHNSSNASGYGDETVFMNFKNRIVLAGIAIAMVAVMACGTEEDSVAAGPTLVPTAVAAPSEGIPPPNRVVVDAPIDVANVEIRESFPVQYAVAVQSGLPNACHAFDEISVERDGDVVNVHVTNTQPAPSGEPIACAEIYGMVDKSVTLPGTYDQGTTYTVNVNDKVLTFEGQDPVSVTQTDDRGALSTADELSDLFQDVDNTATIGDEAFASFFGISGEAMTVFGERVEIYVFDRLEHAEKAASGIKPDGSIVGADGSISMVTWIATPHFYVRGDTIMLYVGENNDVLDFLDTIAARRPTGSQAGGIIVLPEPLPIAVGEPYPEDIQNVMRGLERRFGEVLDNGTQPGAIFGIDVQLVLVGDGEVQFYEFGDAEQAKAASGRISPDGGTITSADGQSVSSVRWIGPAHFYLRGNLITLYVGDSIEIYEVLDSAAGDKFAGPRAVVIEEPGELIEVIDGEFKIEAAPVEKVEVMILESYPPQYVVNVTIGLPSGCHEFNSFATKRDGEIVSIQILNQTPAVASICTLIYGYEDIRIPLEGPFEPGVEFDVLVNGERQGTFVGQG